MVEKDDDMVIKNNRKTRNITDVDEKDIPHLDESYQVIDVVSEILEEIIEENRVTPVPIPNSTSLFYAFTSKKIPQITINKYLKRLMKYAMPEPSTLIISLIYIDKICENTQLLLTKDNIHRFVLASVILALKYNEDDYYTNAYYARVGGITLEELNLLEYNILIMLEFNVFIDDVTYSNYEDQLFHGDKG